MRLFLTIERAYVQPLNVDNVEPVAIQWVVYDNGNRKHVMAMADGRKLGGYVWDEAERALYELYVQPGLRKRGIARRLMEHAITTYGTPLYLYAEPFIRMRDETPIDLTALRAFYTSMGFVPYPPRGEDWMVLRTAPSGRRTH